MNYPSLWCLGMPPQGPHVTDGGLIRINGDDRYLCRPCWRRWITDEPWNGDDL